MVKKIGHLQGIRAIAIVAVVLFHFIPWNVPNGFLGVDMFFVLSGYLMTRILSKEELSASSMADFWYRRIKRILPLYFMVIFLSTVTLLYFSLPNLPSVLDCMIYALTFSTNLQPSEGNDYFDKLALAIDLFAHTWSLCVELHFYFIFPALYFMESLMPDRFSDYNLVWFISGVCSLVFYLFSSTHIAFNCVLARLWQFVTGIVTFNYTKNTKPSADNFLSYTVLSIVIITMFSSYSTDKNLGRLIATSSSALLIAYGEGNCFLENKVAIFLGEISYAWYLVHWPVLCYQRQFNFIRFFDFPLFIVISLILAVIIFYSFERFYLKWSYYPTFVVIFLLALGCILIYLPLSGYTQRDINRIREFSKNYTHFTEEEVIRFNEDLFNLDIPLLTPENCTYREKPQLKWQGFCEYEEPYPMGGNNTLMVIGNSWAANVIHLIHEECSPYVKNISMYSVGGCDVLPDVIKSCKITPKYVDYVEKMQPDILFIIVRPIDLKHVDDGMLPLEDSVFASSLRKIVRLEQAVKKRIFILNAFHNINPKITLNVNNYIRDKENNPHPRDSTLDLPNGFKVGRIRTEEIVRRCKKCELFDYAPYLSIRNRVTLYDPETFVTFVNSVQHLTLPGQEKIRPLYQKMCQRLPSF